MPLFKKDRLDDVREEERAREMAKAHRLLVVDDEPDNLRVLFDLLSDEYHVHTVTSGSEALDVLGREPIDMILTDHRMPGMTGVELLGRSLATRPHCVRAILTGYIDVEAIIAAINQGHVHHYVTKPWDTRELLQTVRRSLAAHDVERQIRSQTSVMKGIAREILVQTEIIAEAAEPRVLEAGRSIRKRVERLLLLAGVDVAHGGT